MSDTSEFIKKKMKFGDEEFDITYRKLKPKPPGNNIDRGELDENGRPIYCINGWGDWPELNPRTYEVVPGIICDQDVKVPMRDGTITYADIYRPAGDVKVPAIISWSFYGKRPSADFGTEWQTYGVPYGSHSESTKFEGPDPLYWCFKGYAIVNYDIRGIGNSEGDTYMWSSQEGRDGYDLIEWLAEQDWCTGKIGMAGNSALAMAQWRIAAEQPPHLTCIAPWEGTAEAYREFINKGGITESGFNGFLVADFVGNGYIEDIYQNSLNYPLNNAYWEDKVPQWEKIEVPAYVTGGWNHFHLRGATSGFRKISSTEKWFRVHRDFEWPDQYSRLGIEELTLFMDRYLKGIRNGWESVPRVRIDVMDAYDFDYQLLRPEEDWPIPRTEYKKLYLDAKSRSLNWEPQTVESKCHYDGNLGKATFDITFNEETEITGHMLLHMWVEAESHDDMDIFVAVQKLDEKGKWLPCLVFGKPHPGAPGRLRVSLRETIPEKSEIFQPYYPYDNPQKLSKGEIVPIDIEIWPQSKIFHEGEQLRVEIMGHYERIDWFEPFAWNTINEGNHIIHTGGQYDSYLLVPYIPPKYKSGNYIVR